MTFCRTGTQRSSQYCWQTSFIIWTHLSPTGEHTCFADTSTVNRSPHQHSSRCWLEAPAGSSTEKLAASSGRRRWPICWCCLDHGPGSFDVEDATTLSWSSAAVSEWVCRTETVTVSWVQKAGPLDCCCSHQSVALPSLCLCHGSVLSTLSGVFMVKCVKLMLRIFEFGVLLFDCLSSKCNLSETFY